MMYVLHATTLLFVALKLTGHIAWSWWLVLLPSYILFIVAGLCFAVAGGIWLTMSKEDRKRHRARTALERYADALRREIR